MATDLLKRGDRVQWIGILARPNEGIVSHLFRGAVLGLNPADGNVIVIVTDPEVCVPIKQEIPAINLEKI